MELTMLLHQRLQQFAQKYSGLMKQPPIERNTICLTSTAALETHLVTFIRWALRVTSTGECAGDTALSLLEQAWEAQKLLWQLRQKG